MPRVPISFLIPVVKSIPSSQEGAEAFLRPFGLAYPELYELDRKIDVELFDRLVRESAIASGNPGIGLVQGDLVDLRQLGLISWIMMNSRTLGEALAHYQRYNVIVCSGISYRIERAGTRLRASFVNSTPERTLNRTLMDCVMKSFQKLIAQLLDQGVRPLGIDLAHGDEGDSAAYLEAFGCLPLYDCPEYALYLEPELLDATIRFSDSSILEHFKAKADLLMAREQEGAVASRLRRHLCENLTGEPIRIADAAEALAMSVRSLQERLKAEGCTYKEMVESIRKEFARVELTKSDLSIGEIAWLLGYSEPSAFFSAFRKWTGMTPMEFRRSMAFPTPS
jgi:AraC-like DNA-binding protein